MSRAPGRGPTFEESAVRRCQSLSRTRPLGSRDAGRSVGEMTSRRIGASLFLAWGAVLTVGGLVMAASDSGTEPLSTLGVALLGLAMVGAFIVQLMPPPKASRVLLESIRFGMRDAPATLLRRYRIRGLLMVLASSCLAIAAILVTLDLESWKQILGWVAAAFFGFAAVVIGLQSGPGGAPAMTEEGILWKGAPGTVWIPWSEIRGVECSDFAHQPFLALRIRGDARIRIGPLTRFLSKLNRRLVRSDLSFSLQGIDAPCPDVAHIVKFYLEHPDLRAELGTTASIDRISGLAERDRS